jgi:hypothetical protein
LAISDFAEEMPVILLKIKQAPDDDQGLEIVYDNGE